MPTEGYGFSNDAQGFLGAPSFDAAAVTIGEVDVRAAISLIYPRASSAADNADYDWFIGRSLGELAPRQ